MKKSHCIIPILALSALALSETALADPTSIGVGGGWSNSPYKGYRSSYYPVPHIDYDNDTFFIDDLSAGVYVFNNDNQSLSIGARYLDNEFKPHDSNNRQLKRLDSRHATLLAEIEYSIDTNWGSFSSSIGADMLNKSNSILVNADYSVPFMLGNLIIVPTIGINWANNKHNNYYYGISHKESSRSGLRYYHANGSFTPYIEIGAQYALTEHLNLLGGMHVDKLTGDAANSPMVNKSTVTSFYMGVSYKF
ncbi:MipA/OmpV family protein [Gilliamella sp. B2717]|uniref:MipA/OmpV family protein n=1 Tax=Gilliamella sp. B2717 TaxID=2817996 RepID=UPI00226A1972|nr:MipA/OmpV family protein [Gilliamella sp. B2717]MCX8577848.1 MipA/OmpV family protein [Gilliamella sp. B2717]